MRVDSLLCSSDCDTYESMLVFGSDDQVSLMICRSLIDCIGCYSGSDIDHTDPDHSTSLWLDILYFSFEPKSICNSQVKTDVVEYV